MPPNDIHSSLPASRTDALTVVVINVLSAVVGTMPGENRSCGILVTGIANIWAVVSSVLTFRDIINDHGLMATNLGLFLLGLLVLTIITSVLALISLTSKEGSALIQCLFVSSMLVVLTAFIFCLLELVMAYTQDCQNKDLRKLNGSAFCQHSEGHVVWAVVGATVVGIALACVIVCRSARKPGGEVKHAFSRMLDTPNGQATNWQPHGFPSTTLNRTSALAKACLLAVYWFLVDPDLSWDYTVNGYDINWWTTGQWAKQGVAILNSVVECMC